MVGGIALILVAAALVRPRLSPRAYATLTGLVLAAWAFANIAGQNPDEDPGAFFAVFVVAMLTSVFGLTILASANLRMVERAIGLLGHAFSGIRVVLRPPLAYLARRPVRTGLTTGVFAVIIGMLSLFAVFLVIFAPDYQAFGNGYDVRVLSTGSATLAVPASVRGEVTRALTLPTVGYVGPVKSADAFSEGERVFVPLFEVPASVAARAPVRIERRDEKYRTDADVWRALARDPRLVVTNFGTPGSTITLAGRDGPVTLTVAGSQTFGLLDGVFGTARGLAPFSGSPRGASMLLDLEDRSRARAVARSIERDLFTKGVDADSVQKLLDDADRANRTFFSTVEILMRMGLIVGILSLGIVGLRIVIERRHVIGVLRALGYKRRAVMAGLMGEAVVTATIGVLVGTTVGVIMGYLFFTQGHTEGDFGIDFASLGTVLALVYVAVLLVTVAPAWRASRLPPAVAVRYVE
jgi:putative ABC transport system permease protein